MTAGREGPPPGTRAGDAERDELDLLRDALRRLVDAEVAPSVLDWEEAGGVPRELFGRLGELGFLGMSLAPEHGGGGRDFRYTAVLVVELVRCGSVGVAVSVLAHAEFATKVIDRAGSAELRAEVLPGAISGERIGALGVTEPGAGSDVAAIRTRAVREGGDYLIDGAKTIEACEALTARALERYVAGEACDREVSMAKLLAAESAVGIAHDCAQLFGGYGYMEESPIARLARDSLAFSVGAGTGEVMREIISREAGLVPEAER